MRAILDTHVILWWVTNNPQLSSAVRDIIADSDIETLRSQVFTYNSTLSTLDDQSRQIKETEQQLRNLSEQMLLGVAAKYGKNSREYGKVGGVPKSERRRPTRKPTAPSNPLQLLQPLAIATSTNGNTFEPINSNDNGNGKMLVS